MARLQRRSFEDSEDIRTIPHGRIEVVELDDRVIGRMTYEPGWRWSTDVKPIAGTELCEAPHFQYHISGTLRVRMADGSEFDVGPGEVAMLPPGHDAWVVGDEPAVVVDWGGAHTWGKPD